MSSTSNTRTLIQMNRDNIKELFKTNGSDIYNFLFKITQSYSVCSGEAILLGLLELLYLNRFEESNIINIFNKVNVKYNKEYSNFLLDKIIDNYNNFYLVDKYYYGYWYDESCYTDDTLSELVN